MPRLPVLLLTLLIVWAVQVPAASLALVRDSAIVIAQTPHGEVPVKLAPVTPGREVTAIILSGTFEPGDMARVRRSLLATFPAARIIEISTSGDAGALLIALCAAAAGLPSNWAQAIIVGRLPAPASDEASLTAWLTEAYTARRARVSFWSIDGSAPAWAQNLSAATAGTVATSGLSALLPPSNNRASAFFEANWDNELKAGAWPPPY